MTTTSNFHVDSRHCRVVTAKFVGGRGWLLGSPTSCVECSLVYCASTGLSESGHLSNAQPCCLSDSSQGKLEVGRREADNVGTYPVRVQSVIVRIADRSDIIRERLHTP